MEHDFYFDPKNIKRAYNDMCRLDREYQIRKKLIRVAARRGLPYPQAVEAADGILEGIVNRNAGIGAYLKDTEEAVRSFQRRLDLWSDREEIIDSLYLGVILMDDPEARRKLNWNSAEEVLETFRDRIPKDYAQKREAVGNLLRSFALPWGQLTDAANDLYRLSESPGEVARIAREHVTSSSVLAMHLYLDNRETMTPQQAAVIVCTEKDFRTIGGAIQETRKNQAGTADEIAVGSVLSLLCGVGALFSGMKMRSLANATYKKKKAAEKAAYALIEETAGALATADLALIIGAILVAVCLLALLYRHQIAGWAEGHFLGVDDETLSHLQAPPKQEVEYDDIPLYAEEMSYEEWDRLTDALVY